MGNQSTVNGESGRSSVPHPGRDEDGTRGGRRHVGDVGRWRHLRYDVLEMSGDLLIREKNDWISSIRDMNGCQCRHDDVYSKNVLSQGFILCLEACRVLYCKLGVCVDAVCVCGGGGGILVV